MLRFYLIRHGETEWNKVRKMQGHKDSPLSELGLKQANALCEYLKDFEITAFYSSPSNRALTTAKIIKGNRDIEIIEKKDFMEFGFGNWEGVELSEIEKIYPVEYDKFWNAPDEFNNEAVKSEGFENVRKRALRGLEEIKNSHTEGNIFILSHALTIKILMEYFSNTDLKDFWKRDVPTKTSISILDYEDEKFIEKAYGMVNHLEKI